MPTPNHRPEFYKYLHQDDSSLDTYVSEQIRIRLARRQSEFLDERNIHSYQHGNRWTLEQSKTGMSELHSVSAESTIHSTDVINHETSILEKHVETMVDQLYAAMVEHLFQTIGEAAQAVGNAIGRDEHRGNIPAGFLAMIEKVEFGVDRYGSAQRPSVHVAPSMGEQLIKALTEQPVEYHMKVEAISEAKEKNAIARETERITVRAPKS